MLGSAEIVLSPQPLVILDYTAHQLPHERDLLHTRPDALYDALRHGLVKGAPHAPPAHGHPSALRLVALQSTHPEPTCSVCRCSWVVQPGPLCHGSCCVINTESY